MAEYKKLKEKIKTPSFFFLLLQIFLIILTDAVIFGNRIRIYGAIASIVFLIVITLFRIKINFRLSYLIVFTAISGLIVLRTFTIIPEAHKNIPLQNHKPETKIFTGEVISCHEKRFCKNLIININSINDRSIKERKLRGAAFVDEHFEPGTVIKFLGSMSPITYSKESDSCARNMLRRGINQKLSIKKKCIIEISHREKQTREVLRKRLGSNHTKFFNKETASFLNALYTGNKSSISNRQILLFRKAGVMHVLAASGLHIGILTAIPLFFGFAFKINKKVILILTLPLLFFYFYITDYPVSLLRASLMFLFFVIQTTFNFQKNSLNILFLSCIVILLIDPADLFNPGFQLSFGACGGILIFYKRYFSFFSFLPHYIRESVSVSSSAQTFVIPLLLIHFKEMNITGILSSIFEIPLTAFTVFISLTVHFLSVFSERGASLLGNAADLIHTINLELLSSISIIPGHFSMDIYPILFISVACIPLYLPLLQIRHSKLLTAIFLCIILFFSYMFTEKINIENQKVIYCIEDKRIKTYIAYKQENCLITGPIESRDVFIKITTILRKLPVKKIFIAPVSSSFSTISSYSAIVKSCVISKCIITDRIVFTDYMKKFFKLLEKEEIMIIFRDSDRNMNPAEIMGWTLKFPGKSAVLNTSTVLSEKKNVCLSNYIDSITDIQYIYNTIKNN